MNKISHGQCGRTWTGSKVGHCSGCHREFSGQRSFDLHQRISGGKITCLDPVTATNRAGNPVFAPRERSWGTLWVEAKDGAPPQWSVPGRAGALERPNRADPNPSKGDPGQAA